MTIRPMAPLRGGGYSGTDKLLTAEDMRRQGDNSITVEDTLARLEGIPGALEFRNGVPTLTNSTASIVVDEDDGIVYGRKASSYAIIYNPANQGGGGGGPVSGITETRARQLFYLKSEVDTLVANFVPMSALSGLVTQQQLRDAIADADIDISDWDNTTTYAANALVIRVNKIFRSLRENTDRDPPDNGNDWVFIGRSEEALRDVIDREIRAQGGGGGSAGALGPYQDKLILIANAITTQNDSTFTTSTDRNEGIGAFFTWRRDATDYSATNMDGLLRSQSATSQLNTQFTDGQNFVQGFGHLNFLKGYFHSDAAANSHTIHGHKPSNNTSAIDEIPLIRLRNGAIEYNRAGIRGSSLADQDWVAVQTSQGNAAGYNPGSTLSIVWEENLGTGHLYPNGAPPDFQDSSGPYREYVLGYHTGSQYVQCDNFRVRRLANQNMSNPTSDIDVDHDIDFWDATHYSTHDEFNALLARAERGRLLGKLIIHNHISSHTRIDFPGAGGVEFVGGIVDEDGDPVSLQGEQGLRGPRGYSPKRLITLTAHGADEPAKPVIPSNMTFDFQNARWNNPPSGWGYNRSSSYSSTAHDIWGGIIDVDENGNVFGGLSDLIKLDGESLDQMETSGLSEAEVDERIATWARASGASGTIPDAVQPATFPQKWRATIATIRDAITGATIVAKLTALSGNAKLPASAIRDLPTGGGGSAGITSTTFASPTIGAIANQFYGTGVTLPSSGYISLFINTGSNEISGGLIPVAEILALTASSSGDSIGIGKGIGFYADQLGNYFIGITSGNEILIGTEATNRPELGGIIIKITSAVAMMMTGIGIMSWNSGDDVGADQLRIHNLQIYQSIDAHTMSDANEPGMGDDWKDHWNLVSAPPSSGSGNLATDPLTNSVILPENYTDYKTMEAIYRGAGGGGFKGQFSVPVGWMAAQTETITTLRSQGADRLVWNPTTRTFSTNDPNETFEWIELTR